MEQVEILGIKVNNVNLQEAAKKVEDFAADGRKHYIVTPNPEIVVLAQKDQQLRTILNSADLAIPDGIGLKIASAILADKENERIRERVAGVDLMENICQMAEKKNSMVGLLGGKGDIAEKCANVLQRKFPKLRLVVFKENIPIAKMADILFVAFGAPKQEKWIWENLPKIPVKVAMGVGGAFEMIAGAQKRAPRFAQSLGLEWLWRLILQPWRIKRQIKLLIFSWMIFKQKFSNL